MCHHQTPMSLIKRMSKSRLFRQGFDSCVGHFVLELVWLAVVPERKMKGKCQNEMCLVVCYTRVCAYLADINKV